MMWQLRSLEGNQAAPNGAANRLGAIGSPQLSTDCRHVKLDSLVADPQPDADGFVGQSFSQQFEHLPFAWGQRLSSSIVRLGIALDQLSLRTPVAGRGDKDAVGVNVRAFRQRERRE